MAYSFVTYTSAGGQTYNVPFPYLDADHVKVYINGVAMTDFSWSDGSTIHLDDAPAVGAIILIMRETPRDGMDKSFSAQPRLKGGDLDEALLQAYYIGLEALDGTQLDLSAVEAKDLALAAQAAAEAAADLAATYVGSAGAGTYMEVPSAPATDANEVKLYAKDVTGVAELFIRKESNGVEIQVTSGSILNGTPPDASEGTKGIAELATQTETDAGTDDARIVTPKKLYTTPGVYRKNLIINGDMSVWQRGTTINPLGDAGFAADRWKAIQATDAVITATLSSDVPTLAQAGIVFRNSVKIDVTTADATIGAGQAAAFTHRVEGYNIAPYKGATMTLSFWVKSTKTGTYNVVFLCAGADRVLPVEYTISQANTWEKKVITFMIDNSAGTWDWTTGVGLQVRFVLAAADGYKNGTNGVWGTTGLYGTASGVNFFDSTSNDLWLTGVQLEQGSGATPFEVRPYADELRLCQRYYERIGAVAGYPYCHSYLAGAGVGAAHNIWFRTTKRVAPTVDVIGTWVTSNCGQPDAYYPSPDGCCLIAVSSGAGMATFYPADATCYVTASAEI